MLIAVIAALLAAACNAVASVLQRRGAMDVPQDKALHLSLLIALVRKPIWLFGLLAMVGAFVFQATALSQGDLSLVQPLLLAELPITLVLLHFSFHLDAGRRAWVGVVGMCVGLAAVLTAASPSGGRSNVGITPLLLATAATGGLVVVAILAALRTKGNVRAAIFGIAAGTGFALTAALIKGATDRINAHGIGSVFSSWQLYATCAAGAASLFVWQNALQAGSLAAAQPAITVSDPVLSSLLGVFVFGEHVRLGGWLALEIIGALIVVAASFELARSPLLTATRDETQPDDSRSGDLQSA
jgi:drug/metabolite transporter (DMT)-like permease